ncbi:hypothetical protein VKT23_017805 [Stygiomarasmius scandens]|uniref:Uncharacterized protein n=1 Tax=Marasmiellus scandens TaxID=2682957 RepID=A0ABR1ITA9_9AGAR
MHPVTTSLVIPVDAEHELMQPREAYGSFEDQDYSVLRELNKSVHPSIVSGLETESCGVSRTAADKKNILRPKDAEQAIRFDILWEDRWVNRLTLIRPGTTTVYCSACNCEVYLGTLPYDLTGWTAHKNGCVDIKMIEDWRGQFHDSDYQMSTNLESTELSISEAEIDSEDNIILR